MRPRYYRRDGKPCDLMTWALLLENIPYKRVAETILDDGTRISTVWLGLDHGFSLRDDAPPIIFETMVFSPGTKTMEFAGHHREVHESWDCLRYSTEAEAIIGHDQVVRKWKEIRDKFNLTGRYKTGAEERNLRN